MCGLFAAYAPDGGGVAAELVARGLTALAHRGPDGRGVHLSADGRVGLGHTRLSIIDLEGGAQPIANEDGSVIIAVNGELYDHERLRRQLIAGGHRFRTQSDSEIALHLYEDLGPRCLQHLRGEFALVLWDGARRRLFAARDRFGIKPLFFCRHGGTLLLASEVKAFRAAGVPLQWDRDTVAHVQAYLGHPPERTLFAGVRQLAPGSYLIADDAGERCERYWDFDYPVATQGGAREPVEEQARRLRAVLDEAVRLRLRADVPVGCYLSGGLDSSVALGLAARHHAGPIHAYTIVFDRPEYEEGSIAEETARRCGASYRPILVGQAELAAHFGDSVWHAETFALNAHGVAKYLLSRAVQNDGHKVVLTGEGADEVFAGYPPFKRDMILHDADGQDPSVIDDLRRQVRLHDRAFADPSSAGRAAEIARRLGVVPSWIEERLFAASQLELLGDARPAGPDPYGALLDALDVDGQLAGRGAVHQGLYLWSKAFLPSYVLTVVGDRMEMAHSIEGRVPFLDHHVVELARDLPVAAKISGSTEKAIVRAACRDVLSDAVAVGEKHPFVAPPVALEPSGALHVLLQDTLRTRPPSFCDRRKVVAFLDALPAQSGTRKVALEHVLMPMLSLAILEQRFGL